MRKKESWRDMYLVARDAIKNAERWERDPPTADPLAAPLDSRCQNCGLAQPRGSRWARRGHRWVCWSCATAAVHQQSRSEDAQLVVRRVRYFYGVVPSELVSARHSLQLTQQRVAILSRKGLNLQRIKRIETSDLDVVELTSEERDGLVAALRGSQITFSETKVRLIFDHESVRAVREAMNIARRRVALECGWSDVYHARLEAVDVELAASSAQRLVGALEHFAQVRSEKPQ